MTTLFDATLAVAKVIGEVFEGKASAAGTTTTLIDGNHERAEDFYNEGTIWFLSGDLEGYSSRVSDYDEGLNTYIFEAVGTDSTAEDDRYAVINATCPRWELIQAVNEALAEMGEVGNVDETLTTVADQTEYDLPAGVSNVKQVEIATASSDPYGWQPHTQWREWDGKLIFDDDYVPGSSGYTIRLLYNEAHAELDSDDDVISDGVALERLKWEAAVQILADRYKDSPDNPVLGDQYNIALKRQIQMQKRHRVRKFQRIPRKAGWLG